MKLVGIILIVVGILLALALVPIMFLGSSYPTAGLITPLLCGGSDYQIVSETTVVETTTRTRILGNMQCVNNQTGETSDLTSMLLILSTVPAVVIGIIGLAIYNMGAAFGGIDGMKEAQEIAKIPEVKARLNAMNADLKAGRITYEDYMSQYNSIIAEYKARQAA
jgi:hypothetical protein